MAGDVCGASYLFVDEVTVVTSFKEVSGKLSSASMKRSVGRTDTSSTVCKTERNSFFMTERNGLFM